MQAIELVIVHDLEDMAMTANKQTRRIGLELFFYRWVIAGRIAADVCHINIDLFGGPSQFLGVEASDILSVDVAIYAAQRFKGGQALSQLGRAEVSCVPDLVAGVEMAEYIFIEEMMGVR